jgi:hypothetical protein
MNDFQQRTEGLPVDDAVEPWKWVAQFLQLGQPIFLVKKAWLHARHPSSCPFPIFCLNQESLKGALKNARLPRSTA